MSVGPLRTALVDVAGGTIRDAVITGPDQPYVGALVWLAMGADGRTQFRVAVDKYNADPRPVLGGGSSACSSSHEPPSIDHNEITDKGYINQRAVREHRAADVERLHRDPVDADVVLFD